MKYGLAYNREDNLEYFLFQEMHHSKDKVFSAKRPLYLTFEIGALLLMFLNTDFEDIFECETFIYEFCFNTLYYRKYPDKKIQYYLARIVLDKHEFLEELHSMAKEEQEMLLYFKHYFLRYLSLPYNIDFIKSDEEDESEIDIYDDKDINTKNIHISIDDVSLDFDMIHFLFAGANLFAPKVPYAFRSDNIYSIFSLDFKEFMAKERHIIRRCENCGKYFIPNTLKETKYCDELFENTKKTCRQIGKELAYKKSLKEDKALDMYRRRYMSLASSVSHYGTDKAIERFENYKAEGALMKAKYQNKEITAEEFEKWINATKNK